ncbi:MAG: ABC transporter substrate-binding protein [Bacteroidaceae bacterium]|nr:ABC transporter substrate-binding protein [Bacteroidaceae bacterium]MBR4779386.1 ABC transporter substrate-binding protein [Bacteroidaceae bacterium]
MKKAIRIFALAALLLGFTFQADAKDRAHTLKIYNWADYIDEDLLEEFKVWYHEQTGEEVDIIYQLFDINEVMLAKIETGHEDFDVVCPSEYIIDRMLEKDLILPLSRDYGKATDYTNLVSPFMKDMLSRFDKKGKKAGDYAVPYMWGTTGWLYNPKYVTDDEVSSWAALWNPKFTGHILVKDAVHDVSGSILTYIRHQDILDGKVTRQQLMNDTSDEAIALIEDTLKAAKNMGNIAGWEVDFGKEMMTKGKIWLNLSWSGDAMFAIEEAAQIGTELRYRVPEEGSNVWFDGWVIPKYAKNVKAANYFINYMCLPENALRNMDVVGYVSAVASPEILEAKTDESITTPINLTYFFGEGCDSVFVNDVQYPDASVIERCAVMCDYGDRTKEMLEMWSRIKGDSMDTWVYIVIGVVLLAAIIAALSSKKKKNNSKKTKKNNKRR